jgi:hypothetical protein
MVVHEAAHAQTEEGDLQHMSGDYLSEIEYRPGIQFVEQLFPYLGGEHLSNGSAQPFPAV